VNAGNGWKLSNRYEEAVFVPGGNRRGRKSARPASGEKLPILIAAPGEHDIPFGQQGRIFVFAWESRGKRTPAQAKRHAAAGNAEVLTRLTCRCRSRFAPCGPETGSGRSGERRRECAGRREEGEGDPHRPEGPKGRAVGASRRLRRGRRDPLDPRRPPFRLAPVTPETRKTALLRIRARNRQETILC